jgi:tetratricopeptide (TPR) repeat protein
MMGMILAAGLFLVSMLYTSPFKLLTPFANRPFTIAERVLTQPRALFIYLSIIAVPMTARLSIFHDIDISHSLIEPWTTLAATLGVVGAILLLLVLARRNRLIAFCGLFFFLNHVVESSILNLELIYEHRNYIPSMLLFVPLAMGAVGSVHFFYYRPVFQYLIRAITLLLVVTVCYLTFEYNRAFQTEFDLWSHAVVRYPKASLPHNNLGKVYWGLGLFDKSYEEIKTAVQLDRFYNLQQKGTAYFNLGIYEAYKERNFVKALDSFMKAKSIDSGDPKIWHEIARACMQTVNYQAAQTLLEKALELWPDNVETMNLLGIGYIKQHQYTKATEIVLKASKEDPNNDMAIVVLAQCYRYSGDTDTSREYWAKVTSTSPFSVIAGLALADIYDDIGMLELSEILKGEFQKRLQNRQLLDIINFSIANHAILPYVLDRRATNNTIYTLE